MFSFYKLDSNLDWKSKICNSEHTLPISLLQFTSLQMHCPDGIFVTLELLMPSPKLSILNV